MESNSTYYEFMYSIYGMKYGENEDFRNVLSIWEQNSQGDTRNHRIWEVGNEIEIGTLKVIIQNIYSDEKYDASKFVEEVKKFKDINKHK